MQVKDKSAAIYSAIKAIFDRFGITSSRNER